MARTFKAEEYTAKRNEILDAATRLLYTKGYERMTVQDILAELEISSGAFYHYFRTKTEVLEGFIERMQQTVAQVLLPIVEDPQLRAVEKLQRVFSMLDQVRMLRKGTVLELLRVWYTDDNAIVRAKVDEAVVRQRAPLLNRIVCQGIAEGVCSTPYPEQAGEILQALLRQMGTTHSQLLLALADGADEAACVQHILDVHAAYMEAVERVIGAPANSLARTDAAAVAVWVRMLREEAGPITTASFAQKRTPTIPTSVSNGVV
jgi:AcrR family transcriptional regulator